MSEFTTKINLLKNSIFIKELKVKHFKVLLKTLIGNNPDVDEVFQNLINILANVTPYSTIELNKLSILDFLLIVLHLRSISIGDSVQLEVVKKINTKLHLNLNKVIDTLQNSIKFNLTQTIGKIKIEYQLLSAYDFLFPLSTENAFLKIKKYIKKITFLDNNVFEIAELNNQTFLQLFNALPANYSTIIFKHVTEITKQINNINLLHYLTDKELSLYLTPNTFTFILQILFSKNLLPLYENIFALSKFANIPSNYIEECTPGEYIIFVKLLERVLKEQNTKQTSRSPSLTINSSNFM